MTAHADHSHECDIAPLRFEDLTDNIEFCDDPSNLSQLQRFFIDYLNRKTRYNVLKNIETGQYQVAQTPIRGNDSYARHKLKKLLPIFDFIKNEYKFSVNAKGCRTGTVIRSHAILVTLTFDHKKYTSSEAWLSLKGTNSIINKFKAGLRKKFGSYSALVVKEGTESSYPAPHLIILLDKPILAHKVGKSWYLGANHSRLLLDQLQNIWSNLSGSFLKANAIVDSKGFTYAFKYITKGVNTNAFLFKDTKQSDFTTINTHLFHKLYDLNDIISKKFLVTLGYIKQLNILDRLHSKLKLKETELNDVVSKINTLNGFNSLSTSLFYDLFGQLRDLIRDVSTIEQCIIVEKLENNPWIFDCAGFTSKKNAEEYIESQQAIYKSSAADLRSVATTVPQALALVKLAHSIQV